MIPPSTTISMPTRITRLCSAHCFAPCRRSARKHQAALKRRDGSGRTSFATSLSSTTPATQRCRIITTAVWRSRPSSPTQPLTTRTSTVRFTKNRFHGGNRSPCDLRSRRGWSPRQAERIASINSSHSSVCSHPKTRFAQACRGSRRLCSPTMPASPTMPICCQIGWSRCAPPLSVPASRPDGKRWWTHLRSRG